MTSSVTVAGATDLRALVREWYRTQPEATNLEQAEAFALAIGRVVAECAFECAVEACGTRAGYCGGRVACP